MLFVRNLASTVTEETLEKTFSQFGKLERVKKLKDYAFIHFEERDAAVKVCRKNVYKTNKCNQSVFGFLIAAKASKKRLISNRL